MKVIEVICAGLPSSLEGVSEFAVTGFLKCVDSEMRV